MQHIRLCFHWRELCRASGWELTSLSEVIHRLFVQGSAGMARMLKEWRSFSIQILRQAAERCVFQQSAHYRGDGSLLWDAATHTAWIMQVNRNANLLAVFLHNIERGQVNFLLEDLKKSASSAVKIRPLVCREEARAQISITTTDPVTSPSHFNFLLSAVGSKKKKILRSPDEACGTL